MNDEHEQPDDPLKIPPRFARRSKTTEPAIESSAAPQDGEAESNPRAEGTEPAEDDDSEVVPQDSDARLKEIEVEIKDLDMHSIEAKVRQGELLAEARGYLKEQKEWVRFVTKRLGTNLMDVHRKIRCYEASEKVGLNKLLQTNLSESAIWHLAAPDVPDEALLEAVEQAQSGPVTVGKAERIARESIKTKGRARRKPREPKPAPNKVELANTPKAIGKHIAKTFNDEEIEEAIEWAAKPPSEEDGVGRNRPRMFTAVKWAKDALAKKTSSDLGPDLGTVLIKNEWLHATDGHIFAATPFPHEGEFLVPGQIFARAIKDEPEIEAGDGEVVLKYTDSSTTRIPTLPTDKFPGVREPTGDRYPLKWKACSALRELAGLCTHDTSRPEAMGVWIRKGSAVVVNGKTKARAEGTGLAADLFVPVAMVDFICGKRADPIELYLDKESMWFVWPDGSYAGVKKVELESEVRKLLDDALAELKKVEDPTFKIEAKWRTAYHTIRHSGAKNVLVDKDRVTGNFDSGVKGEDDRTCEIEFPVETPVPEDLDAGRLKVSVRLIQPVLEIADAIDFTAYPKAIPFKSDRVVGLVDLSTPRPE